MQTMMGASRTFIEDRTKGTETTSTWNPQKFFQPGNWYMFLKSEFSRGIKSLPQIDF